MDSLFKTVMIGFCSYILCGSESIIDKRSTRKNENKTGLKQYSKGFKYRPSIKKQP